MPFFRVSLDSKRVQVFLACARATRNYPIGPDAPITDALAYLNLLVDGVPNHAAILLFGKTPQHPLPASVVRCLYFHGTEVCTSIPVQYMIFFLTAD